MEKDITVGLTESTHAVLRRLKEEGVFNEMRDAYRFGIALAIAKGQIAPEDIKVGTILNVGSLDPDGLIQDIVIELYSDAESRPYRYVERLAEWGVAELGRLYENYALRFTDLLENADVFSAGDKEEINFRQ